MTDRSDYRILKDIRFGMSTLVDVPRVIRECTDEWFNQSLTEANDSVVRLGILKGEFHWHKHDDEDEFFFVLEGKLLLDLETGTVELGPWEGWTVPKGRTHRTRAPEKTIVLMIGKRGIEPEGDE
jgi:mannose-6-phosphate isomerase-like protein (cupin superfamily)